MIEKTEAIVLRSVKFQESSLISTLFTRKFGRISVIARGARKPKSRFSAMLTPGQLLEVVFHHKETRAVQTLTEADYITAGNSFRTDLQKLAVITTLSELLLQVLHENDPNEPLFDFLKTMTAWMDQKAELSPALFPYLQIRIADKIGFGLQLEDVDSEPEDVDSEPEDEDLEPEDVDSEPEDEDSDLEEADTTDLEKVEAGPEVKTKFQAEAENEKERGGFHEPHGQRRSHVQKEPPLRPAYYLNIASGSLSREPDVQNPIRLTSTQFQFVSRAVTSGDASIFSVPLTQAECSQLIMYIDKYYDYHVEGIRPRKSDAIFEQLFGIS